MRNQLLMTAVLSLPVTSALLLHAQAPAPAPKVAFEVASVKPNTSANSSGGLRNLAGGRYEAINVPLVFVIQMAYALQRFQLSGGPAWISSDRFDMVAKAADRELDNDGRLSPLHLQQMLRAVLTERFGLVVHLETKELPIYTLVMARQNKRVGPQLKKLTGPDQGSDEVVMAGPGYTSSFATDDSTMETFAKNLSPMVERIVLDRTGLDGRFKIRLRWNQNDSPNVFTAIQEQLGLKLEPGKGPVEVLVIDHVERLTPD